WNELRAIDPDVRRPRPRMSTFRPPVPEVVRKEADARLCDVGIFLAVEVGVELVRGRKAGALADQDVVQCRIEMPVIRSEAIAIAFRIEELAAAHKLGDLLRSRPGAIDGPASGTEHEVGDGRRSVEAGRLVVRRQKGAFEFGAWLKT